MGGLLQCHTSLLGIREHALQKKGKVECFDLVDVEEAYRRAGRAAISPNGGVLFAFPGECNFSGVRPNLAWLHSRSKKARNVWVLLDAAKYAATTPLDLKELSLVDFVTVSFYKIFGYPSGLGALIVRNDAIKVLRRESYFGGGTVAAAISEPFLSNAQETAFRHQLTPQFASRFEDGTVDFLSLLAIPNGLEYVRSMGMQNISDHVSSLTSLCMEEISKLKYPNGRSLCKVYMDQTGGNNGKLRTGSIVAFNVVDIGGDTVGFSRVENLATLSGIQLRTGCFCNPGACQKYLSISASEVESHLQAGHVCGDNVDVIDGKPTGAVRVSFGYASTEEDVRAFIGFLKTAFLCDTGHALHHNSAHLLSSGKDEKKDFETCATPKKTISVQAVYVYPIKSCTGFRVPKNVLWPVALEGGLLFDRKWALVTPRAAATGELVWRVLQQKKYPEMAKIRVSLDLDAERMVARSSDMDKELVVAARYDPGGSNLDSSETRGVETIMVCGEKCFGVFAEETEESKRADAWFSKCLGFPVRMISSKSLKQRRNSNIRFSNAGQILLVNRTSVVDFADRVSRTPSFKVGAAINAPLLETRFRPNLVVETERPYEEDNWKGILQLKRSPASTNSKVGKNRARFVTAGPCSRCRMVNIDPRTGEENDTYLKVLNAYRRVSNKGAAYFGQLLSVESKDGALAFVAQGDEILRLAS
eukprot:g6276.t1